jgi:hypothetical protein
VNTIGCRDSPLTWFKGECRSFSRAVVKSQHWRRGQQTSTIPSGCGSDASRSSKNIERNHDREDP